MVIPPALLNQLRHLDEEELRRLRIVVRGLLLHIDGQPYDEPDLSPMLAYRQESVRCGKASCGTCPHGTYRYAYRNEGGRTRKRYIGRHLPGEDLETVVPADRSDTVAEPEDSERSRPR